MRTRILRGPAAFGTADEERPRRSFGHGVKRNFDNDARDGAFRKERSFGGSREGRSFGGNREGRSFGSNNEGRAFGGNREGRSFGGNKEGRSFGGNREGRDFGANREGRSFGGNKEGRSFGGNREGRSFGGNKEGRSFGGNREGRSFGGNKEGRSFGGNREGRSFGGNREGRDFGGNREGRSFGGNREGRSFGANRENRNYGSKREDRPFGNRGERGFAPRKQGGFRSLEEKYNRPEAPAKQENPEAKQEYNPLLIRLNKFIANSGICSRREADEYIQAGLVTVNGEVVDQVGTRVNPSDDVRFNGERLKGEQKVYIIMNKPKDFVTTTSDPHAEKNVMDLISKDLCPERIFPIGRLDKATTGVLLFTNDGELTEKLTHPSFQRKKIYQVTLDKNFKKPDFDALLEGFELEDGFIAADTLSYLEGRDDELGIEIHSGRNRIVRRMFEHLGYNVKKLDRVYFSGLTKKNLRRGQWRFLTDQEVSMLKMGSYE